jgi:two-component system, cell cycle sensor histidine kinase and response regulator CckA
MKPNRVLVVDDKEENLSLLRELLQSHGYEVDEARHGADALEKARRRPPDLIVSDILMPVMDGFVLCREWKKDERLKSIPLIFHTATYTDERDRKFALSLGAEGFIVKPAEPNEFMAILRETIRRAGSSSAAQTSPTADAPARPPRETPEPEESVYLRQYNETLVRKLETKMEQLEKVNRELERDIVERKRVEAKMAEQLEELRRWQNVMLSREGRIQELKREVNDLCRLLGKPVRYSSQDPPRKNPA